MKLLVFISLIFPALVMGQGTVKLDESFDPTSLNDWARSTERIEKIKSLREQMESLGIESDSSLVEEPEYIFRVQLSSTKDYEEAKAFEEMAIQMFNEEVIIHFDSPFYKIRVGRLANRDDAQQLQNLAVAQGYRRAWVVRTLNTPPTETKVGE